ncbi:MAG TPA: DUF6570 domain-containing protein, partial [Nitrososphaeraceae archaeon]|nr:DUF6570 domain-containing protein [Nitrososphaeraceae archaeon]
AIDINVLEPVNHSKQPDGCSCGYYVCWHAEAWLFNDRNLILDPINLVKEKRRVLWHINQLYGTDDVPYMPRNMPPPDDHEIIVQNNDHGKQTKTMPIVQIDAPSEQGYTTVPANFRNIFDDVNNQRNNILNNVSDEEESLHDENSKEIMADNTDEYDPSKKSADRLRIKQKRDDMGDKEKAVLNKKDADRKKKNRDNLVNNEKEIAKKKDADRKKKIRDILNKEEKELIESFKQEISVIANVICDVCKRRCYNMQTVCRNTSKCSRYAQTYLPSDLKMKLKLTLCTRCMRHLTNPNKMLPPAKAYWNNLDPGKIPEEMSCLTSVELRLLSRIVPFLKIIKYSGRFGQYGLKGQAVLFAHDVDEIPEQLFNKLPRSIENSEFVLVTETLENINVIREYEVNTNRLYQALSWLKENNPLYGDVTILPGLRYNVADIVHVMPKVNDTEQHLSDWKVLDVGSKILFSSFNQNDSIFGNVKGDQSVGIIISALLKSQLKEIDLWSRSTFDEIMLTGSKHYFEICSEINNATKESVHDLMKEYGRDQIEMFDCRFDYYLRLTHKTIDGNNLSILNDFILKHDCCVIQSVAKFYGILKKQSPDKYYFIDCNSLGNKGAPSKKKTNGRGGMFELSSIDKLCEIVRRNLHLSKNSYNILEFQIQF